MSLKSCGPASEGPTEWLSPRPPWKHLKITGPPQARYVPTQHGATAQVKPARSKQRKNTTKAQQKHRRTTGELWGWVLDELELAVRIFTPLSGAQYPLMNMFQNKHEKHCNELTNALFCCFSSTLKLMLSSRWVGKVSSQAPWSVFCIKSEICVDHFQFVVYFYVNHNCKIVESAINLLSPGYNEC